MDYLKKQEGFTLVEIIVALAILVIVVFSFTTLYSTTFSGIFRAGDKSKALFEAQDQMDTSISKGFPDVTEDSKLTIDFDKVTVEVEGKVKNLYYMDENEEHTVELFYFLPDTY